MSGGQEWLGIAPARNSLQRVVLLRYVLIGVTLLALAGAWAWSVPLVSVAPVIWVAVVLLVLNIAIVNWRRFSS